MKSLTENKILKVLVFLLACCVSQLALSAQDAYHIRAKDVLNIDVVGEDDLTKTVEVEDDGLLSYPYVAKFKVVGLTTTEVEETITKSLKRMYRNPIVTVSISKSRPVTASGVGAFQKPGVVEIESETKLLNLIAQCGGIPSTTRPEWVKATLIRGGQLTDINLVALFSGNDASLNLAIQEGDVLLLQVSDEDSHSIKVIGEVLKPGSIDVGADTTFSKAIAGSGGVTPKAALSRAVILRHGESIPVDLHRYLIDGSTPTDTKLEPGDTLLIPTIQEKFSVLGAVRLPGVFDFPENRSLDLFTAIGEAGGQTSEADLHSVFISRASSKKDAIEREVKQYNLSDLLSKKGASPVEIKPGDVVYVASRKAPTRASDVSGIVAPFLYFFRL